MGSGSAWCRRQLGWTYGVLPRGTLGAIFPIEAHWLLCNLSTMFHMKKSHKENTGLFLWLFLMTGCCSFKHLRKIGAYLTTHYLTRTPEIF